MRATADALSMIEGTFENHLHLYWQTLFQVVTVEPLNRGYIRVKFLFHVKITTRISRENLASKESS